MLLPGLSCFRLVFQFTSHLSKYQGVTELTISSPKNSKIKFTKEIFHHTVKDERVHSKIGIHIYVPGKFSELHF